MGRYIEEAYDEDTSLRFKHKGIELNLNLTDIDKIECQHRSVAGNKQKSLIVTIHPQNETELGNKFSFIAPKDFTEKDVGNLSDRINEVQTKANQ